MTRHLTTLSLLAGCWLLADVSAFSAAPAGGPVLTITYLATTPTMFTNRW
jgi:hypothetical protein